MVEFIKGIKVRSILTFLPCDNTVLMVWLGSGTQKKPWLGLGKDCNFSNLVLKQKNMTRNLTFTPFHQSKLIHM